MSAEKAETWVEKESATWIILIACGFAMIMCVIYSPLLLYTRAGLL